MQNVFGNTGMGGFNDMLNNPTQNITGQAPQTPQEVQQRKGQWAQMLEDPNAKSALLRMGLTMLQGQREGETGMNAAARAGIGAMDFYAYRNELDRKNALEKQRADLDAKNVNSQISSRELNDTIATDTNNQNKVKFEEWKSQEDSRKAKLDLEIKSLQAAGRSAEAQEKLRNYEIESAQRKADWMKQNPGLVDSMFKAEAEAPGVDLDYKRTLGKTAMMNAQANQTNAQTNLTKAQADSLMASNDYQGQADFIWRNYQAEVTAKTQAGETPMSLDKYVEQYYPQTVGSKGASAVMQLLNNKQVGAAEQERKMTDGVSTNSQTISGTIKPAGVFTQADVIKTMQDPQAKGMTAEQIIKLFESRGLKYSP